MIKKIKDIFKNNKDIFATYKYTLILLFIITIIMAIDFENEDLTELITGLILSDILFFTVETFFEQEKYRLIFAVASLGLSFLANNVLYETTNTPRIPFVFIGLYLSIFLITIYKISKKEENFSKYLLTVFNNNIIFAISAIVLQIGLVFISLATSSLLLEDDYELIFRLEILFFGLFIVPGEIICLNKLDTEKLKISKFLICYLLLPIILISELIMYIYFFKILLAWEMPVNSLFAFITALIIMAFPTIILIDNYKKESNYLSLSSKCLKYTFIPIMLMQLISMLIRVTDHGITISRYFGLAIVLYEVIAFILMIKNKKLERLFLYAALITLCGFTIPLVNSIDVSRISQINRLTRIYKEDTDYDKLSMSEKDEIYNIYYYLHYDLSADKYLPDYIDPHKINQGYIDYTDSETKNIYYRDNDNVIDIAGYNKLIKIDIDEYHYNKALYVNELTLSGLADYDTSNKELVTLFRKYINSIMDEGDITNNMTDLSDEYAFYTTYVSMYYDTKERLVKNIDLEGYLLIK